MRPFLLAVALSATIASPIFGQIYPLAPSPVLDLSTLTSTTTLSGYISVRHTRRNDSTSFQLNRARLTVTLKPQPYIAIKLQGDFSSGVSGRLHSDSTTSGFSVTDAYAEIAPPDTSSTLARFHPAVVVGQFKQPFSLEYLTSFSLLRTASRSQIVDRQSPKRDIGVMAQASWMHVLTLAGALTQGEGANISSNPDNAELAMGRLTVTPLPGLAIAGKLGNQRADHLRGYDARWLWRHLVVEGEELRRAHPLSDTSSTAISGGYALVAYRVLPWIQPVYKWERYEEAQRVGVTTSNTRSTWSTLGLNFQSPQESLRLQLNWIIKSEQPAPVRNNELVAQVVAIF